MNKEYPLIYIEWEDASAYGSAWKDLEEAKNDAKNKYLVKHVGFLIEENDEYLLLAGHTCINNVNNDVGHVFKVPVCFIRKRKFIDL